MNKLQLWLLFHPFMRVGGGSHDGFFFIPIYGNRYFNRRWFRLTVYRVYRWLHAANNAKWWLTWRIVPRHRYHLVNTRLRPGYYDFDYRMLHACMALLCEYIESLGRHVWTEDEGEARLIHTWWTIDLPKQKARQRELMMKCYGQKRSGTPEDYKEYRAMEDQIEDETAQMLVRLMNIRRTLWT